MGKYSWLLLLLEPSFWLQSTDFFCWSSIANRHPWFRIENSKYKESGWFFLKILLNICNKQCCWHVKTNCNVVRIYACKDFCILSLITLISSMLVWAKMQPNMQRLQTLELMYFVTTEYLCRDCLTYILLEWIQTLKSVHRSQRLLGFPEKNANHCQNPRYILRFWNDRHFQPSNLSLVSLVTLLKKNSTL